MKIDAIWVGWGECADYYKIGDNKVTEITEDFYEEIEIEDGE